VIHTAFALEDRPLDCFFSVPEEQSSVPNARLDADLPFIGSGRRFRGACGPEHIGAPFDPTVGGTAQEISWL
jgi:hypothetical protein